MDSSDSYIMRVSEAIPGARPSRTLGHLSKQFLQMLFKAPGEELKSLTNVPTPRAVLYSSKQFSQNERER